MSKNNKIAVITCFQNFDLFKITSNENSQAQISIYSFNGRNGIYGLKFLLYIFQRYYYFKKYEIIAFLDEDFMIVDKLVFHEYLNSCINSKFTFCGVRDGGETPMRDYSPIIPNTFCLFVKTREVFNLFVAGDILAEPGLEVSDYKELKETFKNPYNLFGKEEPYYNFFLYYMRRGLKVKFIETQNGEDNETLVCDDDGRVFGVHTWYARDFSRDNFSAERIMKILNRYKVIQKRLFTFYSIPVNSTLGKFKLRVYKFFFLSRWCI
jgi:hypothetical protein